MPELNADIFRKALPVFGGVGRCDEIATLGGMTEDPLAHLTSEERERACNLWDALALAPDRFAWEASFALLQMATVPVRLAIAHALGDPPAASQTLKAENNPFRFSS